MLTALAILSIAIPAVLFASALWSDPWRRALPHSPEITRLGLTLPWAEWRFIGVMASVTALWFALSIGCMAWPPS